MENLTKKIKTYDLIEIQSLLDAYQKQLEETKCSDSTENDFRLAQINRCEYVIGLIEEALEEYD